MKLYVVGGAVRDELLGRPATDRDWVAVGATPEALQRLGYKPVGRDFPVFLHPRTGEEVALARTERKSGRGYHGFTFHAAPEVTLEQDLARRDLTINAMARDEDGTLVDPYGGQRDLAARVLRHVSPAFAEDPVRLLRVARFAARFHDFSVAPETLALLRRMVDDGEVDALVAERVWQELARGLMETHPSRMLQVLQDSGALPRLLPGVQSGAELPRVLDEAARRGLPLPVRYACLVAASGQAEALSARWKVPTDCRELAALLAREGPGLRADPPATPQAQVDLFDRADAWRRPQRFGALLDAVACQGAESAQPVQPVRSAHLAHLAPLASALRVAAAVDTASVAAAAAARGARGPQIGQAVQAARVQALQQRSA